MRITHIIYPETLKKLDETGVTARINRLLKDEDCPYFGGFVSEDDIRNDINEMKERGYLETFPKEARKAWQQKAQEIFTNPNKHFWEVHRKKGVVKEEAELEDLLLSLGIVASQVLDPKELWDYKNFGFTSVTDFVGSVGASFLVKQSINLREGYKWTSHVNGQILENEISGDMNCDFRMHQDDVTSYKTIDPFGNEVGYRPQLDLDRRGVYGYHSVEASLLVSILKWVEHEKIHSEVLKDNARYLLTWAKSLGQGGGTCTEHFGGFDQNPMLFFSCFEFPIPKLNPDNSTTERTGEYVGVMGEGYYGIYVGHSGELVFSYENPKNSNPVKGVNASFQQGESDHLIKGLFYQSAKGLGRTSVKQLINILEYRFSPKFEADNKRFKAK